MHEFSGRKLASRSLWQVAGQSCGVLRVFVCVLLGQRGQPCNPMRAPTHRTNKVLVCVPRQTV